MNYHVEGLLLALAWVGLGGVIIVFGIPLIGRCMDKFDRWLRRVCHDPRPDRPRPPLRGLPWLAVDGGNVTLTELRAIGNALIRCSGWRWIEGMSLIGRVAMDKDGAYIPTARLIRPNGPCFVHENKSPCWVASGDIGDPYLIHGELLNGGGALLDRGLEPVWIPDLSDSATVGCLLALAVDAWGGDIPSELAWNGRTWAWDDEDSDEVVEGPYALVAALEAAPCSPGRP